MKLTIRLSALVKIALVACPASLFAQERIELDSVISKARANYPSIHQKGILQQTEAISLQNLNKGYLPQLSLNGQATYQSDVTQINIPFPGITVNPLSKDQYKAAIDVEQVVFDGGLIAGQKSLQRLSSKLESEKIEVELQKVKERVQQIYLTALMLDEQLKQVELMQLDLQVGYRKTEALVKNGVSFQSNLNAMEAELLKADQRAIELSASRKGLINALSLFIGKELPVGVKLQVPRTMQVVTDIVRRELSLFEKQNDVITQQRRLLLSKSLPKASLFGQGGYGRPGLNMLQNRFDWFYIGGIRLNWNISNLYTFRKEKQLADISARSLDLQKETFLLNTNIQLTQQQAEIDKLEALITTDKKIIDLREKIKNAAGAQLENQVINASDYIREVNSEDQARQALIIHQIQLVQAKINYSTIAGY